MSKIKLNYKIIYIENSHLEDIYEMSSSNMGDAQVINSQA